MNNENYIDYMVEDENEIITFKEPKKYSVMKIIAMVLGIIGALGYLYFAIQNVFQPYAENFKLINDYKASGMMEVTFSIMLPYYVSIALVIALIVCPIVGSLLPEKCKSASIILIMFPVSWQVINVIPAVISYIAQGAPMAELYIYFIICVSSLMLLASAILTALTKDEYDYWCNDDEFDVEYYDYDDEDFNAEEFLEGIEENLEVEEISEETEETVSEIFEEVAEEIKEEQN